MYYPQFRPGGEAVFSPPPPTYRQQQAPGPHPGMMDPYHQGGVGGYGRMAGPPYGGYAGMGNPYDPRMAGYYSQSPQQPPVIPRTSAFRSAAPPVVQHHPASSNKMYMEQQSNGYGSSPYGGGDPYGGGYQPPALSEKPVTSLGLDAYSAHNANRRRSSIKTAAIKQHQDMHTATSATSPYFPSSFPGGPGGQYQQNAGVNYGMVPPYLQQQQQQYMMSQGPPQMAHGQQQQMPSWLPFPTASNDSSQQQPWQQGVGGQQQALDLSSSGGSKPESLSRHNSHNGSKKDLLGSASRTSSAKSGDSRRSSSEVREAPTMARRRSTSERYHDYAKAHTPQVKPNFKPYSGRDWKELKKKDDAMKLPKGFGPERGEEYQVHRLKFLRQKEYSEAVRSYTWAHHNMTHAHHH